MDNQVVIARAFRGEPLKRVVVTAASGAVYVANPDLLDEVNSGNSTPVGFPSYDIYQFDKAIFLDLVRQWTENGDTKSHTWEKLRQFRL
jgi:hypothetical protein